MTNQQNSSYTEGWLPIKNISKGAIINIRGEVVTGVKIQPRNIFILEQLMQDRIIENLRNFYNTLDFEFWIIVTDKPVDISIYLSNLQSLYNDNQDPKIRKLILQDMEKGEQFVNNDIVDTEYYLLFKESGKKVDLIQKRVRSLITGIGACGLIATETTNEDLRTILDSFLNSGKKFESGTVMPK